MNPPRYGIFMFLFGTFIFLYTVVSAPIFDAKDYPAPPAFVVKSEPKTILFLGDIMLGRNVENLMNKNGIEYPFNNIKELLASSTYVVANLEGVIPVNHVPTQYNGFYFSFKKSVADLLNKMNITAVSLANNHSYNFGEKGFLDTKKALNESKVYSFGYSEYPTDDIFEVNLDGDVVTVFGLNMVSEKWNEEKALEVTRQIRKSYPDAHLLAFLHWGNEYKHNQSKPQIDLAHALIDNGVDAIIGTHAHVIQGIEIYKERPIFYSLGNFIFDQYFSIDVQDGYALKMKIIDDKIIYEIIPYISVLSSPKVADETNKKRILNVISSESDQRIMEQIKNGVLSIKR